MLFDRQLYRAAQRQLLAYTPQAAPQQLHLQRENASALLFDDLDSRMLVIAGSNDWRDWQQNLTACPIGLWREHAGVWQHAELLAREIRDLQLQFDDKPLDIVGHSLGGAAAIALPLHLPGLNPRNIITFGAPAVFRGAAPAASYANGPLSCHLSEQTVAIRPSCMVNMRGLRIRATDADQELTHRPAT